MSTRSFGWATVFCVLLMTGSQAEPHALTVADRNAMMSVDPHSVFGWSDWQVDGIDHMSEQWFWFRDDDADSESSLDTMTLVDHDVVGSEIRLAYLASALGVDLVYALAGGASGSGASTVRETIILTNLGLEPLSIAWFTEVDLDVGGTAGGDVASGDSSRIAQHDGETRATVTVSPGASGFLIAPFPVVLASLTDGARTDFTSSGPFGPGDATFGLQWDFTIAPGESATIVMTKRIAEPGSILIVVGLAASVVRRSRRRSAGRT